MKLLTIFIMPSVVWISSNFHMVSHSWYMFGIFWGAGATPISLHRGTQEYVTKETTYMRHLGNDHEIFNIYRCAVFFLNIGKSNNSIGFNVTT